MARIHSPEKRAAVVAAVAAGTPYREISAEHGIAIGLISRWAAADGVESPNAERVEAATNATKLKWVERRGVIVDDLGTVAAELLEKARTADARDAQAFATSVAILIDKAQLVSGGATSRHEQLDAQRRRERVGHLRDELTERRDVKNGTTGS